MAHDTRKDLVDRLLEPHGGLVTYLRQARADGQSFPSIALALREHGIALSSDSVRRWAIDFGIHVEQRRAS